MTTKIRIIFGFSVLLVLLGVMAFIGYSSLQTSSNNFVDYRRMANINVDTSDLQSTAYETLYFGVLYILQKKTGHIKEAQSRVDKGFEIIKHALEITAREETRTNMNKSREHLTAMREQLSAIQKSVETVNSIYTGSCLPQMQKVDKGLNMIAEVARETNRSEALYFLSLVLSDIAAVREDLAAFLVGLDASASAQTLTSLANCRKALDRLGQSLETEKGKALYTEVSATVDEMSKGIKTLLDEGVVAQAGERNLAARGTDFLELAVSTNTIADGLMRENGTASLASNEGAQYRVLVLSVAGLLIGVLMAVFIIVALVRTLAKMSLFASDIADGNFDSQVKITEKGEIGAMFAAFRRIPEIFSGVITRCNDIANDISSGLYRDRLDLTRFSGGFRDLAQGINTIADSYTRSIDNLPVAIVTLNTQLETKFVNTEAGKALGNDALKAFGGRMPLLESSMRENKHNAAETSVVTPEGRKMIVAATAIPLRDLAGKVVGGLEVLTDISDIKEKQRIMEEVASQASAIADRVAAASEELAAQVEEVSRGAEIQRERVESTASAMTEMNSTVAEVARSASDASNQGAQTREQAQSGSTLVNKVVESINEVNGISLRLQDNMETLGHQVENIGSVMNVISDIADQTNLLALNAAIEAARAGEAGRGFAVVADEVRKLAENTMNATKEVGSSIVAIQQSARNNVTEVGVAAKNASEATALANESGEALKGILVLASATSDVVASIATAAEEQSAASEEITQAIDEINRLVAETTDGMVQSSSAVQDLSRTAQELKRVMEGLR